MDIREYSYILKIAECGSLTRAAEELYIAQSALSMYIRNLENRLGVKLYNKVGRKLIFTPEGQKYISYAKQITEIDRAAKREFQEIREGKTGSVRLGASLSRAPYILPGFLKTMKETHPGIEVKLSEGSSKELGKMLEMREIDLALISLPRECRFSYTPLFDEEVVIYAPKTAGLGQYAEEREGCRYPYIPMDKLDGIPFIMLREGHHLRRIAEDMFFHYQIKPQVVYETHSALLAVELVEAGLGSTVMYDSMQIQNDYDGIEKYSCGSVRVNTMIVAYNSLKESTAAVRITHDLLVQKIGSTM